MKEKIGLAAGRLPKDNNFMVICALLRKEAPFYPKRWANLTSYTKRINYMSFP